KPFRFLPRAIATAGVAAAAAWALAIHPTAVKPPTMPPDGRALAALGTWIEKQQPGALVYSAHPFSYLNLSRIPAARFVDFGDLRKPVLERAPRGAWLVVEDRFYRSTSLAPDDDPPGANPRERDLGALGFEPVAIPDLGVDMRVTDPRQDPALEHMHL